MIMCYTLRSHRLYNKKKEEEKKTLIILGLYCRKKCSEHEKKMLAHNGSILMLRDIMSL